MGGIDGWQWLRKLDCKNYSCKVPVLDHDGKLIPYFEFEASQTDRCWRGLFFHFFMITSTSQLNCPMFKIWRGRVWEIRKNFYYKILLRCWCYYHSRTDSLLLKRKMTTHVNLDNSWTRPSKPFTLNLHFVYLEWRFFSRFTIISL